MYVKQFDDKNISVNVELANQKSYRYSDWKSIKSHFIKTFGGDRAFRNVVDKKHMAHPLPSAEKWLTHPWSKVAK